MIDIIPYEPAHAYAILERNVRERNLWLSSYPDWEMWVKGWKDGGPAYTLIIDGEIVMSAGVVLMDWNRGEAWTLFTTLLDKYPLTAIKQIKKYLEMIVVRNRLKRLQALIDPEYKPGVKFIEFLGFENEGRLRAYGPKNEDYLMFSRIY